MNLSVREVIARAQLSRTELVGELPYEDEALLSLPVLHIARTGIDQHSQGHGLGRGLLSAMLGGVSRGARVHRLYRVRNR